MKKFALFFLTFFVLLSVLFLGPKQILAACNDSSLRKLRQRIIEEVNQSLSKLSPTPSPLPTTAPQPTQKLPTPTSQPLNETAKEHIMKAVNDYRKSKGLSEVKTDKYTCDFAKTRAQEISTGFNHDGFTNRVNSKTLPYPSYQMLTENIASTGDYKNVVPMWINSAGHAANMEKDTPYVCVESFGIYYVYEGWKP